MNYGVPSRASEWWNGHFSTEKVVFTSNRRQLASTVVRGDQMAEAMNGICLRHRFASHKTVSTAPAVIWIVEADLNRVKEWNPLAPQFLDVINPATENHAAFYAQCQAFKFLLLNTESSLHYLGPTPPRGWQSFVIPHHHCNFSSYQLSEARLSKPRVVGYVGDPVHLHNSDAIQNAVEKMGMRFLNAPTHQLSAYHEIDIGIAWTRRDAQRDETRSNIKMVNFASHGIPAVLCNYESYRTSDHLLGGGTCLLRDNLDDFIEGISELVNNESLRLNFYAKGLPALDLFSSKSIGNEYQKAISAVQSS